MTLPDVDPATARTIPEQAGPHAVGAGKGSLVRYVRVARQGIYDARRTLIGYEMLFRAHDSGSDDEVAGEQATSQVIASTFGTFGLDNISDGKPVFINFTRAFLTGVIPLPVEPDRVVLEVVDNVVADRELMIGLQQLREQGYRIAIHDFQGQVDRSALLDLTDFVKIDVNNVSPILLPGLVKACATAGATMVAKGIEDSFVFDHCLNLGFELFQGYYLQRPTVLEQRTLSPSQLICVRLLNDLADPDVPISRIEHMVGSDPGLTLRLLRTANSASAGASREVTSLRQALVLIGPRRLRSWVVLTLLEGGTTSNASDDLWRVLARAFACQKLAVSEEDLAFTVGLLSGAADLLGSDLLTVVEGSGVGPEARQALLDGAGPAGHALSAVLAHEHDDMPGIEAAGLVPFDVSRAYLESLSESLQLVHELTGHS
ncbi:MAG: HDOD domain-containing protein [Kineosporiaceae bacterium]